MDKNSYRLHGGRCISSSTGSDLKRLNIDDSDIQPEVWDILLGQRDDDIEDKPIELL